ncbi:MAG: hypothetical protein ACK56F_23325 [bacterium]|jgi:hypothetical protein
MFASKYDLRARICRRFEEPRNRFLASRTGTTILFVVLAHLKIQDGEIDS